MTTYYINLILLTVGSILLAVKLVFSKNRLIRKLDLFFKVVILLICFFIVGMYFYEAQLWLGLGVDCMALLAIIKYLFDQKRDNAMREKEN